jgi:hypothetical protein
MTPENESEVAGIAGLLFAVNLVGLPALALASFVVVQRQFGGWHGIAAAAFLVGIAPVVAVVYGEAVLMRSVREEVWREGLSKGFGYSLLASPAIGFLIFMAFLIVGHIC